MKVEYANEGKSGLVFCYGVSGSGKTYTMLGPNLDGMFPSTVKRILSIREEALAKFGVKKEQRYHEEDEDPRGRSSISELVLIPDGGFGSITSLSLELGAFEVHNDRSFDLLNERKLIDVKKYSDEVKVMGQKLIPITTQEVFNEVLAEALKSRSLGETVYNKSSSRSHAFFELYLNVRFGGPALHSMLPLTLADKTIKLCFVDLAGSEKTSKIDLKPGENFKESCQINASLMHLGRCLKNLKDGQGLQGMRDTTLTMLLAGYLHEHSNVILMCNVSYDSPLEESVKVLEFASDSNRAVLPKKVIQPTLVLRSKENTQEEDKALQLYSQGRLAPLLESIKKNINPAQPSLSDKLKNFADQMLAEITVESRKSTCFLERNQKSYLDDLDTPQKIFYASILTEQMSKSRNSFFTRAPFAENTPRPVRLSEVPTPSFFRCNNSISDRERRESYLLKSQSKIIPEKQEFSRTSFFDKTDNRN